MLDTWAKVDCPANLAEPKQPEGWNGPQGVADAIGEHGGEADLPVVHDRKWAAGHPRLKPDRCGEGHEDQRPKQGEGHREDRQVRRIPTPRRGLGNLGNQSRAPGEHQQDEGNTEAADEIIRRAQRDGHGDPQRCSQLPASNEYSLAP